MSNFIKRRGEGLPQEEEIEVFGSDGEEAVYRILAAAFEHVIRNAVVPYKGLYLEKDFLVIERGVPFVIEVKNWKGVIGRDGDKFYQKKDNGVKKTLKSPVGTTQQFIKEMKRFYGIERDVSGLVVFCEPDAKLELPPQMDGIALLSAKQLVSHIKTCVRSADKKAEAVDGGTILRCTRLYGRDREFCKGILSNHFLECWDREGNRVKLDTLKIASLTVEREALRLRDKWYVTFSNGATALFYGADVPLRFACLDGSFCTFSTHRIRHIVF